MAGNQFELNPSGFERKGYSDFQYGRLLLSPKLCDVVHSVGQNLASPSGKTRADPRARRFLWLTAVERGRDEREFAAMETQTERLTFCAASGIRKRARNCCVISVRSRARKRCGGIILSFFSYHLFSRAGSSYQLLLSSRRKLLAQPRDSYAAPCFSQINKRN